MEIHMTGAWDLGLAQLSEYMLGGELSARAELGAVVSVLFGSGG